MKGFEKLRTKSLPVAILLAIAVALWNQYTPPSGSGVGASPAAADSDAILDAAFRDRQNDLQVLGRGTVVHILPDDNNGSRHQRFLLETGSGLTLLVAHNIDLAPRIPQLRRGDDVAFYGEYEWNEKGGVIHWTHHDPGGRHVGGWLEHEGERYE
jgi:hypothetical protein